MNLEIIKWIDIFGGNIIGYIRSFCGLIITFRIMSFVFQSIKQADAMIYFSKMLMHSILVIMILVYYDRAQIGVETIDVLTGFTLLFSAVEIVDNFLMFIKESFSKKVYEYFYSRDNQFDSKREENDFFEMISKLHDIQIRLHPGRVNSYIGKQVVEIFEMFKRTRLHTVNLMIKHGVEKEVNFTSHMNELFNTESIRGIIAYEYHNTEQPIILNYYKCEELKALIEAAIECKEIYSKKLRMFEENKKVEKYINSLEKIKETENKYYGLGEIIVNKKINYRKRRGY